MVRLFQFDQVNTWPEYNYLFWGQHCIIANVGFLSLPVALPDAYRADTAPFRLSHPLPVWIWVTWTVHVAPKESSGVPCTATLTFPKKLPSKSSGGCIYWNLCSSYKCLFDFFSLITILITPVPANVCAFLCCCARTARLHTKSPLSTDRAWGWSQEFMRSYPQPASGLPCGLGK